MILENKSATLENKSSIIWIMKSKSRRPKQVATLQDEAALAADNKHSIQMMDNEH